MGEEERERGKRSGREGEERERGKRRHEGKEKEEREEWRINVFFADAPLPPAPPLPHTSQEQH